MSHSPSKQPSNAQASAELRRRPQGGNHQDGSPTAYLTEHQRLLQDVFQTAGHLLSTKTSEVGDDTRHRNYLLALSTKMGGAPPSGVSTDDRGARERLHAILKAAIEISEDADF